VNASGVPNWLLDELCTSTDVFYDLPRVLDGLAHGRSGRGGGVRIRALILSNRIGLFDMFHEHVDPGRRGINDPILYRSIIDVDAGDIDIAISGFDSNLIYIYIYIWSGSCLGPTRAREWVQSPDCRVQCSVRDGCNAQNASVSY